MFGAGQVYPCAPFGVPVQVSESGVEHRLAQLTSGRAQVEFAPCHRNGGSDGQESLVDRLARTRGRRQHHLVTFGQFPQRFTQGR